MFSNACFLDFILSDLSMWLIDIVTKFFVDVKALDTINFGSKNSKFSILELTILKLLLVSFFKIFKKLHFFLFDSTR